MRRVNIARPALKYDPSDPEGYKSGMYRFGPDLGAEVTGTSVYELPPGQAICPYHYEHGEDEWLMVISGRPTVRLPDGEFELEPWDVMFFPKGPDGAHKVTNATGETVRVMMWGEVAYPTVSTYPDSNKIGVWTRNAEDKILVRRDSAVDYFDGEV
jgi:uncharacterized cupin superfamily protein